MFRLWLWGVGCCALVGSDLMLCLPQLCREFLVWSPSTRYSQWAGGIIAALAISKNDPGFIHNGALAGLVAICAGSDQVHPMGALAIGAVGGIIFVKGFTWGTGKIKNR